MYHCTQVPPPPRPLSPVSPHSRSFAQQRKIQIFCHIIVRSNWILFNKLFPIQVNPQGAYLFRTKPIHQAVFLKQRSSSLLPVNSRNYQNKDHISWLSSIQIWAGQYKHVVASRNLARKMTGGMSPLPSLCSLPLWLDYGQLAERRITLLGTRRKPFLGNRRPYLPKQDKKLGSMKTL